MDRRTAQTKPPNQDRRLDWSSGEVRPSMETANLAPDRTESLIPTLDTADQGTVLRLGRGAVPLNPGA